MRFVMALAACCFLFACGDETTGTGGSGASTTSGTGSGGSSGTTGSTSSGSGGLGGGTTGTGGSDGAGGSSASVEEACESLYATYEGIASDLGCAVNAQYQCLGGEGCEVEEIALVDCLRRQAPMDCRCVTDADLNEVLDCGSSSCPDEWEAFAACSPLY